MLLSDRASGQLSHNAIMKRDNQKYSVKTLICYQWLTKLGNSKVLHYGILCDMPSLLCNVIAAVACSLCVIVFSWRWYAYTRYAHTLPTY